MRNASIRGIIEISGQKDLQRPFLFLFLTKRRQKNMLEAVGAAVEAAVASERGLALLFCGHENAAAASALVAAFEHFARRTQPSLGTKTRNNNNFFNTFLITSFFHHQNNV